MREHGEKLYEDINLTILRYVRTDQRVLDVGCGTGALGEEIKRIGEHLGGQNYVVGIDISPVQLRIAKSRLDEVIEADLTQVDRLSLPERAFDVLIFSDVLEHLYDPWAVLAGYRRYLKPSGYAVVSVPNVVTWPVRLGFLVGRFHYRRYGTLDETHIRFFTLRSARGLMERAGFVVEALDVTPNFIRPAVRAAKDLRNLLRGNSAEYEANRRILNSSFYRVYRRAVYPAETSMARVWKGMFAYQFVLVGRSAQRA